MDRIECARQLRADPNVHYNCCQSVLIPFADKVGMTREQLTALGAHFGSGMRHGSACGAFTGAMMALGLMGFASMWLAVFADSGVAMLCVLNAVRMLYKK